MRIPYTKYPADSRTFARGCNLQKFGGLATAMGSSGTPDGDAWAMLNVDRDTGDLRVRNGYRVISQPQSYGQTSGVHWCQTYSAGTEYGAFIGWFVSGGTAEVFEIGYAGNDEWSFVSITHGGVVFNPTTTKGWRTVCFNDKVYAFNSAQTATTHVAQVNTYTLGSYSSWEPAKPPSSPSAAPGVLYFLSLTDYTYTKFGAGTASYADTDLDTNTGWVKAVAVGDTEYDGQFIALESNGTPGSGSIRFSLLPGHPVQDLTNHDVYRITAYVDNPTTFKADWESSVLTFTNSGGTATQSLITTVLQNVVDTNRNTYFVELYFKFGFKVKSDWDSVRYATISLPTSATTAGDRIRFSPLEAGGIVDWGSLQNESNIVSWQVAYSYLDSSTGYESGLSPFVTLDNTKLAGKFAKGDTSKRDAIVMGAMPQLTTVASANADKVRIYARQVLRTPVDGRHTTAWRRVTEDNDATAQYVYNTIQSDFDALNEYAPSPFDYTNVVSAYVSNNHVVWLYSGGSKNVRRSRDGNPLAQASTDDAFKSSTQDDILRGNIHTLNNDFQDEPVGGVQLNGADIILGKNAIYVAFDTGEGLPKDFSPPKLIPGAPGCLGEDAFCRWHDESGLPIVVYLASDGQSLWAVRVPGNNQVIPESAWEIGGAIRGAFSDYLYGGSASPDNAVAMVFSDPRDDSLHLHYNGYALVLHRQDIDSGKRKWTPYKYNPSTWRVVRSFQSSDIGTAIFAFGYDGGIYEISKASCIFGSQRMYVDIDGSAFTPSSTDTTNERVTFDTPPPWGTGDTVQVSASGGGLLTATTYYLRKISSMVFEFYDTLAHAINTASTVGRKNLTASITASVQTLGRDGGDAINTSIYYQTGFKPGFRRRPVRAHVQKTNSQNTVTVSAFDERGNSHADSVPANNYYAKFKPKVSGYEISYRITLTEANSPIDCFWAEEAVLSQRRHK